MRLIIVSDDSGENESVVFTDDFTEIASDYCDQGQEVTFDAVIVVDLPDNFPLDYKLNRQ